MKLTIVAATDHQLLISLIFLLTISEPIINTSKKTTDLTGSRAGNIFLLIFFSDRNRFDTTEKS